MGQADSRWAKAVLERLEEKRSLSASHSMEQSLGGFLVLLLLLTLSTPLLAQEYQCDPTPNGLSDNCIGCICEASTRCNATTKCISGGSFCGPFLLSKPFWVDGGSCVSKVTHQGTKEPGDVVPWTLFALPTQSAPTSTDLERTVTVMLWSPVKIIQ